MSKSTKIEINDELTELFNDLANCILCPKCKTKVCGEKVNLGPKYHSFEGCKQCAEEENGMGSLKRGSHE